MWLIHLASVPSVKAFWWYPSLRELTERLERATWRDKSCVTVTSVTGFTNFRIFYPSPQNAKFKTEIETRRERNKHTHTSYTHNTQQGFLNWGGGLFFSKWYEITLGGTRPPRASKNRVHYTHTLCSFDFGINSWSIWLFPPVSFSPKTHKTVFQWYEPALRSFLIFWNPVFWLESLHKYFLYQSYKTLDKTMNSPACVFQSHSW